VNVTEQVRKEKYTNHI